MATIYRYDEFVNSRGLPSLSVFYYIRVIFSKMFFIVLLFLSLFVFVFSKSHTHIDNIIKNSIRLITQPHYTTFTLFSHFSVFIKDTVEYYVNLNKINKKLISDNFDLNIKLLNLKSTIKENQDLKDILHLVHTNNIVNYTVKKVNIVINNSFVNRMVIAKDKNDKISENDLVIDTKGNLLGKIINIRDDEAEILMLSDRNFRVPAILEKSMVKVILMGNESNKMKIGYFLGEKINIYNNEKLYTIDDGGTVVGGIYVGEVYKNGNEYFIKTGVDLAGVDNVVILH